MKTCAQCREVKVESCFYRSTTSKDGLYCYCKECWNGRMRERSKRPEVREKAKARGAAWRKANPEKHAAIVRRYNRSDKARAAARRWAKRHPEKVREMAAKYVEENRPLVLARRKAWRDRNPDKTAKHSRTYRASEKGKAQQVFAKESGRLRARNAVAQALRSGALVKPSRCSRCGSRKRVEAHHHRGYAREYRLDVVWLCSWCHKDVESR